LVMMMRGRILHQVRHPMVVNARFPIVSHADRRAHHRCRHCAPDGEEYCKQYQEPDASGFHCNQIITGSMT
jgi:hypothetical protein